jgi:UDP-N-acetyl-D-mannosaminuronic acid dehydrogenase
VLAERGASAVFSDPLYSDDELRADGYEPWDGGPVDAAIVQADHAEYRELSRADLPGVAQIVDGRACSTSPLRRRAGQAYRAPVSAATTRSPARPSP